MTKTEMNRVSNRGTAPAISDVVAGNVDLMFTGPPSAKTMSEGGKLAVSSKCWRRLQVSVIFPTPVPPRPGTVSSGAGRESDITTVSLSTQTLTDDNMEEAIQGMERAAKGQHK